MIIYCMVLHFIADFLLQSREMGKNKSVNFKFLWEHLVIQALVFSVGLLIASAMGYISITAVFAIVCANTLIHGVIDWNIWRLYKLSAKYRIDKRVNAAYWGTEKMKQYFYDNEVRTFKYWEDHYFYVTIGLDQLLHTITLVALVQWFS